MAFEHAPVLIDSSAWIDAFREKTPWVASLIRKLLEDDRAVTCGPVLFEIRRGIRPNERKKVLPLFDAMPCLPFTESDWADAGELDVALRKKGHTIPSLDVLIAHLCLKHKTTILTLDKHFKDVPGLQVNLAHVEDSVERMMNIHQKTLKKLADS